MVNLVTCKNEEDPIKNEGTRVVTALSINIKDAQGAVNSIIGDWTLTKFKNLKLKALDWSRQISHYMSMGIFRDAQGQLTPQPKV